jgi:hypothetical protein
MVCKLEEQSLISIGIAILLKPSTLAPMVWPGGRRRWRVPADPYRPTRSLSAVALWPGDSHILRY